MNYPYVYWWGNNPVRAKHKGKLCRIVSRGKMNSILVEFEDKSTMVTSANAIRKAT